MFDIVMNKIGKEMFCQTGRVEGNGGRIAGQQSEEVWTGTVSNKTACVVKE